MTIGSMRELFLHGLRDIYYAEKQSLQAMSEMMDLTASPALEDNLEHHVEDTQEQIRFLDKIFRALGEAPDGVTCQSILGLIEESRDLVREIEDERVRDAAMVAAAQAIERYEITRYGTLVAWVDQLGSSIVANPKELDGAEIGDLLQMILDQEKNQDSRLTALAESKINRMAA